MNKLNPRDIIEKSRDLARLSRYEMMPALYAEAERMKLSGDRRREFYREAQEARMDLVMDCYLTGCAEMLKALHGDNEPEPWEKYDHETRLKELLERYGLLHREPNR